MNLVKFRWIFWNPANGEPPRGAVSTGTPPQQSYQVLQYQERENMDEIGLQEPLWSEWMNT